MDLFNNNKTIVELFDNDSDDGQFYVLALSQNAVKLFQGSRYGISELDLEEIPTSLAEALRYDSSQKQQQLHTATAIPSSPGHGRPVQYHGQGVGTDEKKDNLLRFFQNINEGLQSLLKMAVLRHWYWPE